MTAIVQTTPQYSMAPTNFGELERFAKIVAGSELAPKDYRGKPDNIIVAVQMGAEVGLAPMQALANIAVINGRASVWGDAMLALCMASPHWGGIEETDDGNTATCTVTRKGMPPVVSTFSMEDAKRAGLAGKQGPWSQYPRRMRQMRARGFALRDAFPDALRGLHSAEEVSDYQEPIRAKATPVEERRTEPPPRDPINEELQRRMDAEPHDEMPGNAVEYPDLEVTMRGKRWRISQMDAKQLTWCAENHKRDDVRSAAEARMAKLIDEQAAQHRADLDAMGTNAEYGMEPEPATQGELDGDMEDHP